MAPEKGKVRREPIGFEWQGIYTILALCGRMDFSLQSAHFGLLA